MQISANLYRASITINRCLAWLISAGLGACLIAAEPATSPPLPTAGADTPALDAELHEVLRSAGIRPALRGDLQRPVDPRLQRIELHGLDNSGLFPGRRYEAHNAHEIEALSLKLTPGDQLILVGSDWQDAHFTLGAHGTAQAPIFIGAETAGDVVFSGDASVRFYGSNLVIMNLVFRDGILKRQSRSSVLALGDKAHPADNCIVNRITIDNVNSADPADWPKLLVNYLSVSGHGNTIANSTFAHLRNYGEIIATSDTPAPALQQLHILNNRFIDRPKVDHDPCPYRYKIIQIGWSGLQAAPTGSLIQGSLFEDCASNVEIISIKASDVFLRNNRFIRCPGAVNIRMGDRALVQDNVFDGENQPGTGGLRVAGRDHVIIGNTFKNLQPAEFSQMWPPPKPPTRYLAWTFALVAADFEDSGVTDVAYGRVNHVLISHNRFEHNTGRIALGSPTPSLTQTLLLPRNVRIEHNTFAGDGKGKALFDYVAQDATEGSAATGVFLYDNRFGP